MPTQGLIDSHRIGKDILHAVRTHAREVGEQLNESLQFTVEEGEIFPNYIDLQHQFARLLEARFEAFAAADQAHLAEIDDDDEVRRLRAQATQTLYTKLVELRELLRGVYGFERANSLVGITGATSGDPVSLYRQAVSALERLREPTPESPPQRLGGLQLDRNALADELQPFADELGRILEDIKREVRERERSKRRRDEAQARFLSAARAVARFQIALDELAGFPTYAERIRLTLPARGRRSPGEDEEPSEEPRLPDGPPPPEGPPAPDATSAIGFETTREREPRIVEEEPSG